jgi:hypothetical protein
MCPYVPTELLVKKVGYVCGDLIDIYDIVADT